MTKQSMELIIDRLLEATKTPIGSPSWEASTWGKGELRLLWPLCIDNVPCQADLEINAYPTYGNSKEKWRIKLLVGRCIWRIDYVHDEHHINSLDKRDDLIDYAFTAPHYHAWEDNKRFCTHNILPIDLPNARIMPITCRTFPNALRWFCAETNIVLPHMIDLPPRTMFL